MIFSAALLCNSFRAEAMCDPLELPRGVDLVLDGVSCHDAENPKTLIAELDKEKDTAIFRSVAAGSVCKAEVLTSWKIIGLKKSTNKLRSKGFL